MTDETTSDAHRERSQTGFPHRAAMTIQQASEYSGLSRSFIYTLFEQQELRRLKAGKRVLILKADLDEYLRSIVEGAE